MIEAAPPAADSVAEGTFVVIIWIGTTSLSLPSFVVVRKYVKIYIPFSIYFHRVLLVGWYQVICGWK